jgi:hypothetical protein
LENNDDDCLRKAHKILLVFNLHSEGQANQGKLHNVDARKELSVGCEKRMVGLRLLLKVAFKLT